MNVQVKCQDCETLYTVMPSWVTKRGTTMEPSYPEAARHCKRCGANSRRLMISKPHGPLPERRGN